MSNDTNVNQAFAKEAAQRNEIAQEISISAKVSDAIAQENEQRMEAANHLPQEGLFDQMTANMVKGERPSFEKMQQQIRQELAQQPDTPIQGGQTQGGQKH